MQPRPLPPFEMIEAKFFRQLLINLLAAPAGLDGRGERLDRRVVRQIDEIIFALAVDAALPNQPDLFAWHAVLNKMV